MTNRRNQSTAPQDVVALRPDGPSDPAAYEARVKQQNRDRQRNRRAGKSGPRKGPAAVQSERVIAGLVVVLAVVGSVANWLIVARPMMEMLGASLVGYGSWTVGGLAALVITGLEAFVGLKVMKSVRLERWGTFWGTLILLLVLTGIEMGTAYQREVMRIDGLVQECISQQQADGVKGSVAEPQCRKDYPIKWPGLVVQMAIGGVLPFALMYAADEILVLLGDKNAIAPRGSRQTPKQQEPKPAPTVPPRRGRKGKR